MAAVPLGAETAPLPSPLVKRVGALLAAVAMVAGALWVRGRIDGGGDGSDDPLPAGERPVVVCATELAAVCDALDVDPLIEDPGTTLDRIAAGEPLGADGWLVTSPWPEMAAVVAPPGTFRELEVGEVLARSPTVLVVATAREQALATGCAGAVGWTCVGEAAGEAWADHGGEASWGTVRVTHPDPGTVPGLAVLAAAAAGFLGSTGYATNDLATDGFDDWFTGLERAAALSARGGRDQVRQLLAAGPSVLSVVGALEAEAGPQVAGAENPQAVVLYPSPMVTADVVLATVPGADGAGALRDAVGGPAALDVLVELGWRVDGREPANGVGRDALPAGNGLPDPGVLVALRERADEARR